jgi:hypothetical protein
MGGAAMIDSDLSRAIVAAVLAKLEASPMLPPVVKATARDAESRLVLVGADVTVERRMTLNGLVDETVVRVELRETLR